MWEKLPLEQKEKYKKLILAFASLSKMFSQKSIDDSTVSPIINSKYQETVFQQSFGANLEDIGNTSYDVSLKHNSNIYLIGIKTFGKSSHDQKIAQFKAKQNEWASILKEITDNAKNAADQNEINERNSELYLRLAKEIAEVRNLRIDSSKEKAKGFIVDNNETIVSSVYHVLMTSKMNDEPKIHVGEMPYDKIDVDKIEVQGCTTVKHPENFIFNDGTHEYKYVAADCQLYMNFNSAKEHEVWEVKYASNPISIFERIADNVYSNENAMIAAIDDYKIIDSNTNEIEESYSWTIWNKNHEMEMFSGFNSFFGVGSKIGINSRKARINKLISDYENAIDEESITYIFSKLTEFLCNPASTKYEKNRKVELRNELIKKVNDYNINELKCDVTKLLFRPTEEIYIPVPNSTKFHKSHPDFFGKRVGEYALDSEEMAKTKDKRKFNLVFEPSGDSIESFITQENGKAIESFEKQSYLGEWILRRVFQLKEYEPITSERLNELGINGMRFFKYKGSNDIHAEFIWIDESNPPSDYWI